jgi:hypothetical protein
MNKERRCCLEDSLKAKRGIQNKSRNQKGTNSNEKGRKESEGGGGERGSFFFLLFSTMVAMVSERVLCFWTPIPFFLFFFLLSSILFFLFFVPSLLVIYQLASVISARLPMLLPIGVSHLPASANCH